MDKRELELSKVFGRLVDLLAKPLGPNLFQRGIEALCVLLDATYGAVVLKDDSGNPKESIFTGCTPGSSKNQNTFLRQRRPLVDHVLLTQSPLVIDNIPAYLNSIGFPLGHPIMQTFLGVPIARDNECFGCIYLCGEFDEQQFSKQDELVVTSFSQTLALVISQAKDRNERKRLVLEREVLAQLALRLSAADSFDKIVDSIPHALTQIWSLETFALAVRRCGNSRFRYLNFTHKGSLGQDASTVDFDVAQMPEYKPLTQGDPILISSESAYVNCRLIIPVPIENEEMAILDFTAAKDQPFSEVDKNFARRLADIISPSLARCQAETRTRAFLDLAFKLTAATTAEDAARIIAATADSLLTWDACSVVLHHPELQLWQGILHMDIINGIRQNVYNPYPVLAPPGPIARRTMQEGPQLILRDPEATPDPGLSGFGDTNRLSLSLLFVPFRVGSVVGGVFSIQSYTALAYNERDLQLLQALADYCAGAVHRIRLAQGIPDPVDYDQPELTPQIPSSAPIPKRKKQVKPAAAP